MSAYAHEMEQHYSAQSLSSQGGGSEMRGSSYIMESGFYISSFVAAIFIGALLTIGVLVITLIIALAVMLQSCQNRNKGVVEIQKQSNNYDRCKIFSLHAELNGLEVDAFPSVCRDFSVQYIQDGQYERDLESTIWLVENYFCNVGVAPLDDGLDVVLIDIDYILPSNPDSSYLLMHCDCSEEAKDLKQMFFLRLYKKLRACGWPLILLSRKPEKLRNATLEHLISAGYMDWSMLIMRSEDEVQSDSHEYFSRRRTMLQNTGFRITGVISSHMDALSGPSLGNRIFKLPNRIQYTLNHHIKEKETSISQ